MHSLVLLAFAIAACLVFGAIAAVVVAIFQLALAGMNALAARRRRRRASRPSTPLSGRR